MLKRFVLIGSLCFSMMALLQTEEAVSATLGGNPYACKLIKDYPGTTSDVWCCTSFCYGCYGSSWTVTGGDNPNDSYSTIINTTGEVQSDAFVCTNPGGDFDVRQGVGGTIFDSSIAIAPGNTVTDENGKRIVFTDFMCSRVGEDVPNPYDPTDLHVCTPEEFRSVWGDLSSYCRNSNWTPYEYLIRSVKLTGTLFEGCPTDPNLVPPVCIGLSGEAYLECACDDKTKKAEVFCETKEDTREGWPGLDGEVDYTCVKWGYPIAWDDSYSVRPGGTLTVKDIGVLTNDHDTGKDVPPFTTFLTATPYTYVNDAGVVIGNVSNGTLTLNSRGGFKYIPNGNFVGVDTFTYRAYDGVNYSNVATVTITVTQ
jgi:hypothetical protein